MSAIELNCLVKYNRMVTPTVFQLGFDLDKHIDYLPGQFLSIIVPGAGPHGRDLRRAYSIASPPEMRPVELCIKRVTDGPGTSFLNGLKPGDSFKCLAPYGTFVFKPALNRHVCFIATGTGISPFRSMIQSQLFKKNPPLSATCLFGASDQSEILYADELGGRKDVNWVPAISRAKPDWSGFKGRVTDYLRSVEDRFAWLETEYYLCGNGAMIDEVKAMLFAKGVQKTSVHQEVYYKPKLTEA